MRLTLLGLREILLATLPAWGAAALLAWSMLRLSPWFGVGLIPVSLLWLWVLWFFRDPNRTPPGDERQFVSPADGRVSDITPLGADSVLGCEGMRIGIFMNVFNVHVNRSPCNGQVMDITHRSGAFLDARRPEAFERNESTTLRLLHRQGETEHPILIRQVAGLIARRIVTKLTVGQTIGRGERIGMIKWGSRLEVLLPSSLRGRICVRLGQAVRAGETPLFHVEEEG